MCVGGVAHGCHGAPVAVSPCLPRCLWQGLLSALVSTRLGGCWATEGCLSPSARAVRDQTRITTSAVHAGDLDAGLTCALPMEPSSQPSYYCLWKQQSGLRLRFSCPHLPSAGVAGVCRHTRLLCSVLRARGCPLPSRG